MVYAAILRLGAVIVPIDIHQPVAVTRHILRDAAICLLVTSKVWQRRAEEVVSAYLADGRSSTPPLLALGHAAELREGNGLDACGVLPDNRQESKATGTGATAAPGLISHIIYTSGSTGLPKGVVCTHSGLANYALAKAATHAIVPGRSRVLLTSAQVWDPCIGDIVSTLVAGGLLCVATRGAILQDLAGCLDRAKVTHVLATPSLWSLMDIRPESLPHLQVVTLCGEPLHDDIRAQWQDKVTLINGYGVTEATVIQTSKVCRPGDRLSVVGVPLPGVDLAIISRETGAAVTACGVVGEICFGGVQVGIGYINQPELSTAAFVDAAWPSGPPVVGLAAAAPGDGPTDCPASTTKPYSSSSVPDSTGPPASTTASVFDAAAGTRRRWFRTGDLGSWSANGELELVGRADRQVKLRGFRIELDSVEAVLVSCPLLAGCAVVTGGEPDRLVAFVLPKDPATAFAEELVPTLRLHCSRWLPAHAVPAQFVRVDALPMTPSGKVNRKGLAIPQMLSPPPSHHTSLRIEDRGAAPVDPYFDQPSAAGEGSADCPRPDEQLQGHVELAVARAWKQVLGRESVGPYDSFFWDLGGTSITATRMLMQLQVELEAAAEEVDRDDNGSNEGCAQPLHQPQQQRPRDAVSRHLSDDLCVRMCGLHRKPRLRDFARFVEWTTLAAPNSTDGDGERMDSWIGMGTASQQPLQQQQQQKNEGRGGGDADAALDPSTNAEAAESLLSRFDALFGISEAGGDGVRALMHACGTGNEAVARTLLDLGVAPNGDATRKNRTMTPLMVAAQAGHTALVALLLDAGASPNLPNRVQATACHLAAGSRQDINACAACLRLLLDRGGAVNARDFSKWTCVTYAAWSNQTACLRVLIRAGALLTTKDRWSQLPATWAAFRGSAEALRLLLEAGAAWECAHEGGRSAPQAAHLRRSHNRWLTALQMCMYDILQSSKSASSTQHTRGKYRHVCKIPRLRPLSHRAREKVRTQKVRTQSCLPIFASCMLC